MKTTPETAKHTPTPWVVGEPSGMTVFGAPFKIINDSVVPLVADCGRVYTHAEARANAAHIVLCVNSHDALLAALEGVLRVADRKTTEFDAARAAIQKATFPKSIQPQDSRSEENMSYESPLEHSSSPDGCPEDCPACEDERLHAAGGELAAALHLKRDREHKDRWQTAWGTKTNVGLVRTLREMLDRVQNGRAL